jgi:hypothetical protein
VTKTAVITQSNYIPWRGYFDMLRSADEIVLLDSVQYTKRDWRNRNQIKTTSGPVWLTIPVEVKGRYFQAIDETKIADREWAAKHIRAIEGAYAGAAHFKEVSPWLFGLMQEAAVEPLLSTVNTKLVRAICERLNICRPMRACNDIIDRATLRDMQPTARLVAITKALGCDRYISGPAAKAYMEIDQFTSEGIEVSWMDYRGYPEYPQRWGEFEPRVSIVDLLMNTGTEAPRYLDRTLT